jgi:hypothetical protein
MVLLGLLVLFLFDAEALGFLLFFAVPIGLTMVSTMVLSFKILIKGVRAILGIEIKE